ncbi:MAG: carbohydrate ABC transporter permease [Hydrogeniiclostridium sp.]
MTEAVKTIKRKSKIRASGKDKAFLFFVYLFLTLSLLIVLLPLIYVVSASFSDSKAVVSGEVWLLPVRPTLKGYTAVFENPQIMSGFLNSFIYMFSGTAVSLVLTVLAAYPLSRGELAGKKLFNGLFLFTMLFSGGMIPSYILLRDLNMLNTRWAIIIPTALSVWNLIITRTYYQNTIPGDIYEAAYLDGCSDLRILFSIVIPLSGPILAVMGLYYAIGQWNSYFNAMIYLKDQELFPLQIILRNILIQNQMSGQMVTDVKQLERMQGMAQLLKYSVMVVSCLPLMVLYPFVQKFFVKGVMFGAVKG